MRLYDTRKKVADSTAQTSSALEERVRPEPWIAALLSVLMPGLGHGYCRMWLRGLTFFLLATGFVVLGLVSVWANFAGMTFLSPIGTAFYVLCILDAYRCSVKSRMGRPSWISGPRIAVVFVLALVLFMGAFFVVVAGTMAVQFVGKAVTVDLDSMRPALDRGDKVLVNMQVRSISDLNYGDLVALTCEPEGCLPAVLRVIALPGQRIGMEQGQMRVDGDALSEPYISYEQDISAYPPDSAAVFFTELEVPRDSVFLLADVRNRVLDSRAFGPVSEGSILGRVDFRFYPPTRHRQFADSYLSKLTHRLLNLLGWKGKRG